MTLEKCVGSLTVTEARPGRLRRIAVGAATLIISISAAAQLPEDQCPEKCGEVLKECLEQSADRYRCIEVTERCLMACRSTIQTGSKAGRTHVSVNGRNCGFGAREGWAVPGPMDTGVDAFASKCGAEWPPPS